MTLSPRTQYRFVVVVPNYAHPLLCMETLACILEQESASETAVVIVNDGGPFQSTATACRAAAVRYPNVFYIEKSNGGLSSARNAGIDFALSRFENAEFLICIDSDDRIERRFLAQVADAFAQKPWADFAIVDHFTFGLSGPEVTLFSYEGDYRLIEHAYQNLTGASTVFRRRIFDSGLRYDEAMRAGFEDWEFGLRVAKAGYDGIHVPNAGFRYRVRPESMLAESRRAEAEIRGYMRRKHADLYAPRTLLALEQEEFPRISVVTVANGKVMPTSDPRLFDRGTALEWSEHVERLFASDDDPRMAAVPGLTVFATPVAAENLLKGVMGPNIIWAIQSLIDRASVVLVRCRDAAADGTLAMACKVETVAYVEDADLIVFSPDLLKSIIDDPDNDWLFDVMRGKSSINARRVTITGARPSDRVRATPRVSVLGPTLSLLLQVKHTGRRAHWSTGIRNVRMRSGVGSATRRILGTAELLPILPGVAVDIAFLLPLSRLGGAERVTHNVAEVFSKAGMRCHLVIVGETDLLLPEEHRATYASVSFVKDFIDQPQWQESYMGFGIPGRGVGDTDPLLGCLLGFDVVVNVNVPQASTVMAQLRARGVLTVLYLHANGQSPLGRVVGQGVMALPYEHAYDLFVAVSDGLRSFLYARGVPSEKIVVVRNRPAIAITREETDSALTVRAGRMAEPLRVLYLGRLDPRKGILRLKTAMDRLADSIQPVTFRFVGEVSYFEHHRRDDFEGVIRSLSSYLHPPANDAAGVKRHLGWADVVVLPSYAEGAPLSLLEAAASGCVPVSTDVGSVREYIEDGVDGIVIGSAADDAAVIDGFVTAVKGLASDRATTLAMAHRAFARHGGAGWDEAVAGLLSALESRLAAKRPPCAIGLRDMRRRAIQRR